MADLSIPPLLGYEKVHEFIGEHLYFAEEWPAWKRHRYAVFEWSGDEIMAFKIILDQMGFGCSAMLQYPNSTIWVCTLWRRP